MSLVSTDTYTYTTFGGCDIKAIIGSTVIGNLQGVSYSVTREKAPNYVLGNADPIGVSRGKRGVAGSLIFLTLDQQALYTYMQTQTYYRKEGDVYVPTSENVSDTEVDNSYSLLDAPVTPNYPDQIPPVDITLAAVNEAGHSMAMRIVGVDIISSGSGVSVDDLNIEEQMTFLCRGIMGWRPVSANLNIKAA